MQYGTDTKIKRPNPGRFLRSIFGGAVHTTLREGFFVLYSNDMHPFSINSPVARFLTTYAGYDTSLFKPANMILDDADGLLNKSNEFHSFSAFCYFFSPFIRQVMEKVTGRKTARCSLFCLFLYPAYPLFRMDVECPIYLFIGQGAVDVPSHYESAILQDFLPCFLSALGKHFKHTFENVLCPYSVNLLLHILKIQPLIICLASAFRWIVCDG